MSTTPTLLDLIDAYAEARNKSGDSTYNATTKAARDAVVTALANSPGFGGIRTGAALTQGAGEAVEPVAYYNENWSLTPRAYEDARRKESQHAFADMRPAYAAPPAQQLQQAVARGISEFLERTGQYVTNDASREAAIAQDVDKERVGCFLAVEEMLQKFAEDGRIKPLDALILLREIKQRVQAAAAIRAKGTQQ